MKQFYASLNSFVSRIATVNTMKSVTTKATTTTTITTTNSLVGLKLNSQSLIRCFATHSSSSRHVCLQTMEPTSSSGSPTHTGSLIPIGKLLNSSFLSQLQMAMSNTNQNYNNNNNNNNNKNLAMAVDSLPLNQGFPISPSTSLTSTPQLQPGQFFIHRKYGYRAVVLRADSQCKRRDLWCKMNGVDDLEHGRNQPFYLVIPDVRDNMSGFVYVAHDNTIPYSSTQPLTHPLSLYVFKKFDSKSGTHIPIETPLTHDDDYVESH